MSTRWRLALALACCSAIASTLYVSGPPPAHTGGFGEDHCGSCHFENPLNDPGGRLLIEGLPDAYEAGQSYTLELSLIRPGLGRGGFQMSARFAEGDEGGEQAGTLVVDSVAVAVQRLKNVDYAYQTYPGSAPDRPDSIVWTLNWKAPRIEASTEGTPSPVVFHVAANAANGDDSEFGDFIYIEERVVAAH